MPSISERLKSHGVKIGKDAALKPKRAQYPIEKVLEGEIQDTIYGQTFVVEELYTPDHQHGKSKLGLNSAMGKMAEWAKDARIANSSPDEFAFLDTETSGLAGGSGTYAFIIGIGQFDKEGFRITQLFLRDPAEEQAMLTVLEEILANCQTLVTFNGKSFDIPLLRDRYITNSWKPPLQDLAHLDLLHLARRLWREMLPSRTLGSLESNILGETRSEEDTPGWMIPQMYFDFLASGDSRPLKGVFYHNAMDILSMAGLTEHMAIMLEDPLSDDIEHELERVAIARLYEDLGYWDQAAQIFERSLDGDLPDQIRSTTSQRLSMLHKRRGEMPLAISLWLQAAADRDISAHVELAKYFEHTEKNFSEAMKWTQAALAILNLPDALRYEKHRWNDELKHRMQRLQRRIEKAKE